MNQSLTMQPSLLLQQRMTPQLQQAIKLLTVPNLELRQAVQEELDRNPLLELAEEPAAEPPPAAPAPEEQLERDWAAYLDGGKGLPSNKGNVDFEALPDAEAGLVAREDLFDHLSEQLADQSLTADQQRLAALILGNLDDDGYLRLPGVEGDPIIRLAAEAEVSLTDADRLLRHIQQLEPRGCGSRDLRECLLVQARAVPEPAGRLLETLVKRHLKTLESRNLGPLARQLGVPLQEVVEACRLLARLDPRPGRNFSGEPPRYITPDVSIIRLRDDYVVVLNDDGLSRLRVSHGYQRALAVGAGQPRATRTFLKERLHAAQWFIRAIHQRQRTIRRVTESILKFQRAFLDHGVSHLRPLVLRDVADDIEMHPSTVSRVTSNKYVDTPRGIYELKYFFDSSLGGGGGGEGVASETARAQLRKLVTSEDPRHPWSDQQLVALLEKEGTPLARRTVAKYREQLGILPSGMRRRF